MDPMKALSNMDRSVIDRARMDCILALPPFTLFRCGWHTPSGNLQGQMYYRVGDGLGPVGRDTTTRDVLRSAIAGTYDRPWAIEVLAQPCERHIRDVVAECPGCSIDGSNAMGLRGHLSDCIYNPMRVDT